MATFQELMAKSRELSAQGKTDDARRVAQIALKVRKGPQTNLIEQTGIGTNEGLASIAGFPVDVATGALNLGARGINAVAGTNIPQIENPVGGSEFFNNARRQVLRDVPPQTAAQRYGRRIGQEVGASAIPGGAAMRSAQAPMRVAGLTGASAVGSGISGQTSREIAPDSALADFVASTLGGGIVPAAAHAMTPGPKAPTLEQLKGDVDAGYDAVRQSNARLSQQSAGQLADTIDGTFGNRAATRRLNPKAAIAGDEIAGDLRTAPPTISEVDEARRWIGQNVAGSREAGEARIGMSMKGGIDSHLDNLQPGDLTGTNRPGDVVETLKDAREKAHRIHKSQIFEAEDVGAIETGLRRAAVSGTGGNEVNALRQNVRRVLENPKLRKGFSEVELQAMRDVADGTPSQNALRWASRFAPSSGAIPSMTGIGAGGGLTAATGNPIFLAPSALGEGAKYAAERSTRRQVNNLGELIRNGKPLPKKQVGEATQKALIAWLLSRGANAPEPTGKTKEVLDALLAGQ